MLKPDNVRLATQADKTALYYALVNGLAPDNLSSLPFAQTLPVSEVKIKAMIDLCANENGAWCGIIDAEDGSIAATTAVVATQPFWSEEFYLAQSWLYVNETERSGKNHANDLFKFCRWIQDEASARAGYRVPLETSVLSRNNLSLKLRLWARHAEMVGGVFYSE